MSRNEVRIPAYLYSISAVSNCLTIASLALCELHLALAALTLRVLPHIQLYETTEEDILYDYDMLVPMPKVGTNGVRAILVTE